VAGTAWAVSSDYLSAAEKYFANNCIKKPTKITGSQAVLCFTFEKLKEHDTKIANLENTSGKRILNYAQYRGTNFTTNSLTDVPTDAKVDISCPEKCILSINYYVDTRLSFASGTHGIYTLYLDGINQSYVNQVSAGLEDQATPLTLNALIPANAGTHTIQIYTRVTNAVSNINEHTKTLSVIAFSE